MAKFRDSTLFESPSAAEPIFEKGKVSVHDRAIGEIIRDTRNLTAEQVEQILSRQREAHVRFGEAAVALGFVSTDDVLYALAQQFHYPYSPAERREINPELVTLNQPFSVQAEAFRATRSQVIMRLFNEREPHRAVAIVSPDSGDGKTYFSANLAVTLAQLGGRTLLVDADLRGPRQHEVFGISNIAGLSGILSGRAETQVIQQVVGVPSLFVLPAGTTPPNPLELVERPAFGLLIRELLAKFDHLIVDTPAAIYGSDATVITARCGAGLVVARRNRSRVAELQALANSLASGPTKLAGIIVNEF